VPDGAVIGGERPIAHWHAALKNKRSALPSHVGCQTGLASLVRRATRGWTSAGRYTATVRAVPEPLDPPRYGGRRAAEREAVRASACFRGAAESAEAHPSGWRVQDCRTLAVRSGHFLARRTSSSPLSPASSPATGRMKPTRVEDTEAATVLVAMPWAAKPRAQTGLTCPDLSAAPGTCRHG
jgi:hypothetical protein